ncbi:MAG: hypothetical protein JWP84_959 [Tardiphaga sp.]|nr:hypothetical protein [Tardiphaga sp.]
MTAAVDAAAPGHSYAYKASLIGAAHRFELTEEGLSWRTGRRSGLWRYADIAAIRLSYRPMGMQNRRFRADIHHADGGRIAIMSTSKQTVALMQPQAGYAAFILQLHRQLAVAGGIASLSGGLRPGIYTAIVVALALVGIAMAALLVRALVTGEFAGAVFIVGFSALFGWQIGGFLRCNKPRNYTFGDVPADLLP